jgi:type III pantothenate kinase
MLLCLDIGNSQIHAGLFDGGLRLQFRKTTHPLGSSDEFGVFFTAVLRENGIDPRAVKGVAICSVVPQAHYSIRSACVKYFRCEPFVLQAGVKTGLKVRYRNPHEVGADRIAGAIAATVRHPNANVIVAVPQSTIQSGIYHGHVGAVRQLVAELTWEAFNGERPHVVGTGGFARLLDGEKLFDEVVPELVLLGLKRAEELNRE